MSATEVAIFQKILTNLAAQAVSDLYLRAGSQPVARRDGELSVESDEATVSADFLEAILAYLLTPQQRQILEQQKQITIGYNFANRLRLRLSVFYQHGLPELTMRFIGSSVKTTVDLGLPPALAKLTSRQHGLILITGPFGSGRSTTVASLLSVINHRQARHIVTIEEPIEYALLADKSLLDQREVGQDVNSWEEAVGDLPNEDCDVIALSRLPSGQIINQAIDLALGGKLVLAVTESDSSVKTIERLLGQYKPDDQDSARTRLADALLAISFQQLIPRVGGGRVLVPELLLNTPPVKSIIQEGKYYRLNNLLQTSRAEGMMPFDFALAQLTQTGEIMQEIAIKYAHDLELFKALLQRS